MTQADRIRELAAKGYKPAEIVRKLGVPRPSVQSALRHTGPRGRPSEGKDHRVSLRLSDELLKAIERAQLKDEPLAAAIVRLIQRGLK